MKRIVKETHFIRGVQKKTDVLQRQFKGFKSSKTRRKEAFFLKGGFKFRTNVAVGQHFLNLPYKAHL